MFYCNCYLVSGRAHVSPLVVWRAELLMAQQLGFSSLLDVSFAEFL
jgi:hypothetical protein